MSSEAVSVGWGESPLVVARRVTSAGALWVASFTESMHGTVWGVTNRYLLEWDDTDIVPRWLNVRCRRHGQRQRGGFSATLGRDEDPGRAESHVAVSTDEVLDGVRRWREDHKRITIPMR